MFIVIVVVGTPFQHNYYSEGLEKGYFVKHHNGSVWKGYSDAVLLNISNTQAYDWMVNIIANVGGEGEGGRGGEREREREREVRLLLPPTSLTEHGG